MIHSQANGLGLLMGLEHTDVPTEHSDSSARELIRSTKHKRHNGCDFQVNSSTSTEHMFMQAGEIRFKLKLKA